MEQPPAAAPAPAIRLLREGDQAALARFFELVARDLATLTYFRPHPLTANHARQLVAMLPETNDLYFAAFDAQRIVGYGMLRGWDEGYETPAFGVCVAQDRRGEGLASRLIEFAIARAKERGAPAIMLKVHPDNTTARALYEQAGFVFAGEMTPDGAQEIGRLPLDGGQ